MGMWTQATRFFVFFAGDVKAVSEPECKSGTWIGILVAVVILSLLVIFLLVLKICKVSRGKKADQSLWTEQHALNTQLCTKD